MTDYPAIEGYQILRLLGEGACGKVYLAEQVSLGRQVALKVLHEDQLKSAADCQRFQREARILARLNHPNLVRVLGYSREPPNVYIAMEYLSGGTLRDLVEEARRSQEGLGVTVTLRIVRELLDALAVLHAERVVHRDIKPRNILFRPSGEAVLSDLGVAKLLSPEATALTAANVLVGTLAYLPPESFSGSPATPSWDLFAVGVVAYEAITGKHPTGFRPFPLTFNLEPPGVHCPECPVYLERLILDLLAPEPSARPASAAAALERLDERKLVSTSLERTPCPQPPPSSLETTASTARRTLPLAVVVAAIVAFTGLLVAVGVARRQGQQVGPAVVPSLDLRIHGLDLSGPTPSVWLSTRQDLVATWRDQPTHHRLGPSPVCLPVPRGQPSPVLVAESAGGERAAYALALPAGASAPRAAVIEDLGVVIRAEDAGAIVSLDQRPVPFASWMALSHAGWVAVLPGLPETQPTATDYERIWKSRNEVGILEATMSVGDRRIFCDRVWLDGLLQSRIRPIVVTPFELPAGEGGWLAKLRRGKTQDTEALRFSIDPFPWTRRNGPPGRRATLASIPSFETDVERIRAWQRILTVTHLKEAVLGPPFDLDLLQNLEPTSPTTSWPAALVMQQRVFGSIHAISVPWREGAAVWERSASSLTRLSRELAVPLKVRWLWVLPAQPLDGPGGETARVVSEPWSLARAYLLSRCCFPNATVLVDLTLASTWSSAGNQRTILLSPAWARLESVALALGGVQYRSAFKETIGGYPCLHSREGLTAATFAGQDRRLHAFASRGTETVTVSFRPPAPGVLVTPRDDGAGVKRRLVDRVGEPISIAITANPILFEELVPVQVTPVKVP